MKRKSSENQKNILGGEDHDGQKFKMSWRKQQEFEYCKIPNL